MARSCDFLHAYCSPSSLALAAQAAPDASQEFLSVDFAPCWFRIAQPATIPRNAKKSSRVPEGWRRVSDIEANRGLWRNVGRSDGANRTHAAPPHRKLTEEERFSASPPGSTTACARPRAAPGEFAGAGDRPEAQTAANTTTPSAICSISILKCSRSSRADGNRRRGDSTPNGRDAVLLPPVLMERYMERPRSRYLGPRHHYSFR